MLNTKNKMAGKHNASFIVYTNNEYYFYNIIYYKN